MKSSAMLPTIIIATGILCGAKVEINAANAAGSKSARQPIPELDALTEAERLVETAYGNEIASAKGDADEITKLAKALIDEANDSQLAERYALLMRARDLAVDAPNIDLAFLAIDEIDRGFQVNNVIQQKEKVLFDVANRRRVDNRMIVEGAIGLITDAIGCDHYDIAKRTINLTERRGKRERDRALRTKFLELRGIVDLLATEFEKANEARNSLANEPGNAEANFQVGKFYCFLKGDWDNGLPYLARGNIEKVKALAASDLRNPTDALARFQLARDWSELADSYLKSLAQQQIQVRAAYWYQQALPRLRGVHKTAADNALKKLPLRPPLGLKPCSSASDNMTLPEPQGVMRGLEATYFIGTVLDPERVKETRIVQSVNWHHKNSDPDLVPGLWIDNFSIMYRGFIKAPKSGIYTLIVPSNDGVRLFLDDKLIVDQWRRQRPNERQPYSVRLTAELQPIRIDFFELADEAHLQLFWKSEHDVEATPVPESAFYFDPAMPFIKDTHQKVLPIGKLTYADLQDALKNFEFVIDLSFPNRGITVLPPDIYKFTRMEKLALNNNRLSSLPVGVNYWSSLRDVDLSHNALKELPSAVFYWALLKRANLSHNRLISLPNEALNWRQLEHIDLSHNQLVSLPDGIGNWRNLRELDLRGNPIGEAEMDRIRKTLANARILFDDRAK
jgi:hypothetical protein